MDTSNKAIVIGLDAYPYCDCVPWDLAQTINFADYHKVIVLLRPFNKSLPKLFADSLSQIQTQLSRHVGSRGDLVIVVDRDVTTRISVGSGNPTKISKSFRNVVPPGFLVTFENGDTIESGAGNHFEKYLERLQKWRFYVTTIKLGTMGSVYRANREGGILACRISALGHHFDVIPQIPELSDTETATEILKAIEYPIGPTPPPSWTEEIDLPGLSHADEEISEQESVIETASNRLVDLKVARSKMEGPIRLLYASGPDFSFLRVNDDRVV